MYWFFTPTNSEFGFPSPPSSPTSPARFLSESHSAGMRCYFHLIPLGEGARKALHLCPPRHLQLVSLRSTPVKSKCTQQLLFPAPSTMVARWPQQFSLVKGTRCSKEWKPKPPGQLPSFWGAVQRHWTAAPRVSSWSSPAKQTLEIVSEEYSTFPNLLRRFY